MYLALHKWLLFSPCNSVHKSRLWWLYCLRWELSAEDGGMSGLQADNIRNYAIQVCLQELLWNISIVFKQSNFRKFSDSVKRKLFPQGGDDCKKQYEMCTQEITFWWAPWKQTCTTQPVFTLALFVSSLLTQNYHLQSVHSDQATECWK